MFSILIEWIARSVFFLCHFAYWNSFLLFFELFSLALPPLCLRFQSSWCAQSLHNHYVNCWPPTGTNVLSLPPPVNTHYARPSGRWKMNLMGTYRRRVLAGRAHWKQMKPIKCRRCKCIQWHGHSRTHILCGIEPRIIRFTSYLLMCTANAISSSRQSVASGAQFLLREERIFPRCIFPQLAIMDQLSGENSFKRVAIEIRALRRLLSLNWSQQRCISMQ